MFSIPVSNGEIIDKITILKIKLLKVKDPIKLQNIKKEYELLIPFLQKINMSDKDELFIKLYKTNLDLWGWQDWQREKWFEFGKKENFINIELYFNSQKDYQLNDKRARIKKEINIKTNSKIVEEKMFTNYSI